MPNHVAIFDMRSKLVFFVAGILIPMILFAWAYQSGKRFLGQEIPLVDSIMQLRVDITAAHSLMHEYVEGHQGIAQEKVEQLITKIRADTQSIHHGYVQMGTITATTSRSEGLKAENDELNQAVQALVTYMNSYSGRLEEAVYDDQTHDEYFKAAEWAAAEFDHEIHKQFSQSLDQQPTLFGVVFLIWLLTLVLMLRLLRNSRLAHAREFERGTRLSQAIEYGGSAMIITDTDARITYVNAAFTTLTGYEPEDVIGKKTSILSSGNQDETFYTQLWRTIGAGEIWQGELINRCKDGSVCPIIMSIAPLRNSRNEITHYVASQQDMSDFVALEKRVFMSQKLEAAGILAGGIAHDFKNALTAIKGNAQMIMHHGGDAEAVSRRAESIDRVCTIADRHISQLLKLVRKEALEHGVIGIKACMQSACEVAAMGQADKITIQIPDLAEELYVNWNEVEAQQVMINLINNASYAVQNLQAPKIEIDVVSVVADSEVAGRHGLEAGRQYATVTIRDNGCGIPADQLEKIFDLFFTTKKAGEGTGLGLSMAHSAISKAGGVIDVDSRQGEGTSFVIWLPVVEL